MKKAILILVMGLLSFNINNVIAAERVASFSCGTIDGPSEGISLSIDLDKRTMEFGLPKYKITSIIASKNIENIYYRHTPFQKQYLH